MKKEEKWDSSKPMLPAMDLPRWMRPEMSKKITKRMEDYAKKKLNEEDII